MRLLKLCRYYYGSVLLGRALKKSVTALAVPIAFLLVLCVSIGGIMFSVEGCNREDSHRPECLESAGRVQNIPQAMWMMLVTMTTVGYGDFSPLTLYGRLLSSIAMFIGLVMIAMPLTIVGTNFAEVWAARERRGKETWL